MIPSDPVDGPSVESEACDCCGEPWAWEAPKEHGPRMLRLCEEHATEWLRGERELAAEREEIAGRVLAVESAFAPLFGLASTYLDGRVANGRKAG